jgi:hypothetical protein
MVNFLVVYMWNSVKGIPQKDTWMMLRTPELEVLKSLWGLGTEEEYGYRTGPPMPMSICYLLGLGIYGTFTLCGEQTPQHGVLCIFTVRLTYHVLQNIWM